mmetsp:Transcript_14512/g.32348  ORF Transcript_14512/g.32348 Transcript_14512/m.32348 type:complete len:208 (-) Transcript_14512:246-869(-)
MTTMRNLMAVFVGCCVLLASSGVADAFSPAAVTPPSKITCNTRRIGSGSITTTNVDLLVGTTCSSTSSASAVEVQGGSVTVSRSLTTTTTSTSLRMGLFDDIQSGLKRLTQRATASHILINFAPDAEQRLEQIRGEIDDSPVKFAEMAQLYSACPSSSSGGSLGEFGRGQMVKEFDEVVFNEEVGKVHGPIETKFGYHLILVSDRND